MTGFAAAPGLDGPAMAARVRTQVGDRLTTAIRDDASKAGWPNELVTALTYKWDGHTWTLNIDDRQKAKIDDLEYGDLTHAPNPVIRRFMARAGTESEKAAGAALVNFGLEVL